jgi:dolichol-phosphate mannosyltransferase
MQQQPLWVWRIHTGFITPAMVKGHILKQLQLLLTDTGALFILFASPGHHQQTSCWLNYQSFSPRPCNVQGAEKNAILWNAIKNQKEWDSMVKKSDYLIIIPAYNEAATIEEVVTRSKKHADVCVINDNSKDATPEILNKFNDIHVIHHEKNTHIPGGLLDGMRYAVANNYLYAIAMDAGLSHNPDEIPLFVQHPHCDLAIGVRIKKINTPLSRKMLSNAGNIIYNMCLNFPQSALRWPYYRDITSGYRRYSSRAMQAILSKQIESKSFDILFETAMIVYREKLSFSEVPISYNFSNSSLNPNVVKDCMRMCLKHILNKTR